MVARFFYFFCLSLPKISIRAFGNSLTIGVKDGRIPETKCTGVPFASGGICDWKNPNADASGKLLFFQVRVTESSTPWQSL